MAAAGDLLVAMATVTSVQNTAGTTNSASYTATLTGGTTCSVVFVAPPSGNVLIHNNCEPTASSTTQAAYCSFEVRAGATPGSGTVFLAAATNHAVMGFGNLTTGKGRTKLVTGLTPGSTYNARQLFLSTSGTATFEGKELIAQPVP